MLRFLTLLLSLLFIGHPAAQADAYLKRVGTGFSNPIFLTAPSTGTDVYVVEQGGRVKILDPATGTTGSTFLDLSGSISTGGERGLLGLAFSPDYETSGRLYVNYTNPSGATVVSRITMIAGNPNEEILLTIAQPFANHNAGWMGFGQDGYLYIASGDGGSGNDPQNHGQNLSSLLGKMLRIDVSGTSFYSIPSNNPFGNEIVAYGLRNPWRSSFDRSTGDLYIADVGQGAREEIDVFPSGETNALNYGWRLREGFIATPGIGGALAGAIDPIYDYTHGGGNFEGLSVTGGYVYRGSYSGLQGRYLFSDFVNPRIWAIDSITGSNREDLTDTLLPDLGTLGQVSSFGEDAAGEVYVVDYDGDIFRITEVPVPTWEPVGWNYMQWPYAYAFGDSDWRFFSANGTSWQLPIDTGVWDQLSATSGWLYWQWPYFYQWNTSTWHYFSVNNAQWVNNLTGDGQWYLMAPQP